jgi:hypothetical protein
MWSETEKKMLNIKEEEKEKEDYWRRWL